MNILLLAAYAPVLHMHGGGVRMFHNIRILAQEHSVRVISFIENDEEREMLRSLDGICESVSAVRRVPDFRPHWLSVLPFLVREFSTPEMYRAVENEFRTKRVDVLQCEYLQMAQFHRPGTFTILTLHEVLSANAYKAFRREKEPDRKFKLFYRWMQILRYEVMMSRKFDRVVAMTANDAEYLGSYSSSAHIHAIPIGIDPDEFAPLPEEPARLLEVLFVGNFRHSPNLEAAEFLIHQIAPQFPDIRFVIPGSYVPDAFHRESPDNVSFPGYVPDTRTLYRRPNTIVVAPLFSGTGQRVKLLEAFAMGCPVVTTSVGAAGFSIRSGVNAFLADTAVDFAAALREIISSEELRRSLGQNARDMIVRDFTWHRIGRQLLDLVC
jgi:glycosyltransferase involved in cell wall biosynthesis